MANETQWAGSKETLKSPKGPVTQWAGGNVPPGEPKPDEDKSEKKTEKKGKKG